MQLNWQMIRGTLSECLEDLLKFLMSLRLQLRSCAAFGRKDPTDSGAVDSHLSWGDSGWNGWYRHFGYFWVLWSTQESCKDNARSIFQHMLSVAAEPDNISLNALIKAWSGEVISGTVQLYSIDHSEPIMTRHLILE